ncbi:cytochrome P450 [Allokutzneria sp. A3M-2-11 16]|uniref:cytochrome P450 n=1 Tax=Allokutzneria sp. A3M-2-11 16 TaxID=2962043 RepID=UPI0020B78A3A|nr:cytochrome P450 [Allokutzneria sp. A3M-2-11 16]MCP3803788.1 cytochrome P450 [Allokutzneria sp. A3M-2-11 16]
MYSGPDPFAVIPRGLTEPDPARAALRAAGPIVEVAAPEGGSVWIVTEEELARTVFTHPDLAKDTALAPPGWIGLEPTAAEQPALTTTDGPEHTALRRAHAPLINARHVREHSDRVHEIARDLLGRCEGVVDLMAGFTVRYPLTVVLDLLGIPLDHVDEAADACLAILDPRQQGAALCRLVEIARTSRVAPPDDEYYHLFSLIFAGQITTDTALGFLIARVLGDPTEDPVRETLREHPPAPFSLWRFATAEVELAGTRLPVGAPVLVDIQGVNARPGPELTFGAGPHFCIGAQLAQLELRAVLSVLRTDFPHARLAVPYSELRQVGLGGIQGSRLTALPVDFGKAA